LLSDEPTKLVHFPALVSLFRDRTADLLSAVLQVPQCAEYLDVPQTTLLLGALFDQVCAGTEGSGAAYARVVARKQRLELVPPGLRSMDPQLVSSFERGNPGLSALHSHLHEVLRHSLKTEEAAREYIAAISACGECASFAGAYAIAQVVAGFDKPYSYAALKLDRALAAVAGRCAGEPADASWIKGAVRMGITALPETMGALVKRYMDANYRRPKRPNDDTTRILADDIGESDRLSVEKQIREIARFVFCACDPVISHELLADNLFTQLVLKIPKHSEEHSDYAYVAESLVLRLSVTPLTKAGANRDLAIAEKDAQKELRHVLEGIGTADLLALWTQHPLVRSAIEGTGLLKKMLNDHAQAFDKVISCKIDSDSEIREWLKDALRSDASDVSIALERAPLESVEPFAGQVQSAIVAKDASIPMVRLCAVLARLEHRLEGNEKLRSSFLDALKSAWKMAPSAVLDAAEYLGVAGQDLFDLLVAGAKWGRYEQISRMTNLFGDWQPQRREDLMHDPHTQIVGAFFGFCERAKLEHDEANSERGARWNCSESGSHDDAMVAFSFWKQKPELLLRQYAQTLRDRGFSGIHGILTAVHWAAWDTPTDAHNTAVEIVDGTHYSYVARAVRMTPHLVMFVDPERTSRTPLLMALATLIPKCAALLGPAQRAAVNDSRETLLDEAVEVAAAITGAHEPGMKGRIDAATRDLPPPAKIEQQQNARLSNRLRQLGAGAIGNADIRRVVSAAYLEHIRGGDAEYLIGSLAEALSDAPGQEKLDYAITLIQEYNELLKKRGESQERVPTVPFRAQNTPRAAMFGRKRQFV
jgi:hypothetical protein